MSKTRNSLKFHWKNVSWQGYCCLLGVLLTVLIIGTGLAEAYTYYVPDSYPTIQAAINAATDGDTIIVKSTAGTQPKIEIGTLSTNTKNNLTIEAEEPRIPTIVATGGSPASAVYIESVTGTTIEGFTLRREDGPPGNPGMGSGVFVNNENGTSPISVTINNCGMSGGESFHAGVRLRGRIQATIIDNNIVGPQFAGIATSVGPSDDRNYDYLTQDSIVTIQGNTIDGNGIAQGAGIFLKGSSLPAPNTAQVSIVAGNTIKNHGAAGIRLEDIYGAVTVDNNDIFDNVKAGVCLIDVGSDSEPATIATIQNNNIYDEDQSPPQCQLVGLNIAGATYATIGGNNRIYGHQKAGIAFNRSEITDLYGEGINASSQAVTIQGNEIYINSQAGIAVVDEITGAVTIDQNDIHNNDKAGIAVQNDCSLVITRNNIHDHSLKAGIKTGTGTGGAFSGTPGGADLTIRQNKIHHNGGGSTGAGIDVRHASGIIQNNLVYANNVGGLRFADYISEITHNTIVGNGAGDQGGGIIYDDPSTSSVPDGTLKDSPNFPKPFIRSNIVAYNEMAGLRVGNAPTGTSADCPDNPVCEDADPFFCEEDDGLNYRDYNLLYANHLWNEVKNRYNEPDCAWPSPIDMSCTQQQYAGCGAHWDFGQSPPIVLNNPNDMLANPLFYYDCLIDGDTATGNSPGGGTYVLFDLHNGPSSPSTYEITDVRLYSATTYTWDVHVGNDPAGCTGGWGTQICDNWPVGGDGTTWYEKSDFTPTAGRYIKLVTTANIAEDAIFEFQYKSTETGTEAWQTPVMVVYECTDIAEDNYQSLSGSPAITAAHDGTDMGAYGGDYPIVDSEIPGS